MTAAEHPLWHPRPKSTNLTGGLAVPFAAIEVVMRTDTDGSIRSLSFAFGGYTIDAARSFLVDLKDVAQLE